MLVPDDGRLEALAPARKVETLAPAKLVKVGHQIVIVIDQRAVLLSPPLLASVVDIHMYPSATDCTSSGARLPRERGRGVFGADPVMAASSHNPKHSATPERRAPVRDGQGYHALSSPVADVRTMPLPETVRMAIDADLKGASKKMRLIFTALKPSST